VKGRYCFYKSHYSINLEIDIVFWQFVVILATEQTDRERVIVQGSRFELLSRNWIKFILWVLEPTTSRNSMFIRIPLRSFFVSGEPQ
jgi:hypothetical protein